jgi:3-oxoacyl-[acyl-carrier protein] reductase
MDLSGKVAIVTGGARGIGREIALRLAQAGAAVAVSDIENAEMVAEEVRALGPRGRAVITDVTSSASVNEMVEMVAAEFGRIDILVNNAGITRDGLLMRMSDEDWDAVLNVNLKSVFLCSRAVLRTMMKQRSGRIISISSVVGIMGNPGQANYASSKAGIIGLTRTLAREVGSRGITVNAIAPGFIQTRMTEQLNEEQQRAIASRIPLGFLGTPRDVAEAVAFLASEEARYITGQVLGVDGGLGGL